MSWESECDKERREARRTVRQGIAGLIGLAAVIGLLLFAATRPDTPPDQAMRLVIASVICGVLAGFVVAIIVFFRSIARDGE